MVSQSTDVASQNANWPKFLKIARWPNNKGPTKHRTELQATTRDIDANANFFFKP